jgi:hypothetical protein
MRLYLINQKLMLIIKLLTNDSDNDLFIFIYVLMYEYIYVLRFYVLLDWFRERKEKREREKREKREY